ncbi:alpha beta-hydrolase [Diplodia corticola]|uniref:Alpha beta-hydrolase n=1 Tax=Diplodia corticola TaxID=236234 RepID=A0A1J9QVK5_9PEZI|nr:alpha beta-hydrolase [Diplodia corticola]OJD32026.1 alpha beta-hydrolase [Diplodia corticola]
MMQSRALALSTKPGARLRYSTLPASPEHGPFSTTVLVFLNGLLLPRSSWIAAIETLVATRSRQQRPVPHLLTYDRYGQGDSDPDPADDPRSLYGHDASAVVTDLHRFLVEACHAALAATLDDMSVVFVANSIGCPLARLYAAEHPGRVAAYLFLDSMMANTDFVSLFPDPDVPASLPAGITVDDLRKAREGYRRMFHPTVPNPEHFDRRNLPALLPEAGRPQLPAGPKSEDPYLIIVGHDPDEFAEQGETGSLHVPKALTNAYINPPWQAYNNELVQLAPDDGRVKRPVIADKCGHFIQRDGPEFVAEQLGELLDRLG